MKTLSIAILAGVTAFTLQAQVSIIGHKTISESPVTTAKVGAIYSLDQTKWSDGTKIVVFDNSTDTKADFYSGIGKDQLSLNKIWMKKQLTGEAKAPEKVGSDDDVVKKVATTPGAIGYVKSSAVRGDVKVLLEIK
ncbi:MAG: hypothetical protein NTV54_02740 [Ignavibacteriales bacterium]|nr:hypothetical protein [Ignavibacteriales bacterium]